MSDRTVDVNKLKNVMLAPLDKDTVKRIKRISSSTGESATAIINAAVQVLEKSLGRQLIVRPEKENWDLKINHFRKYKKVIDLKPDL